MSLAVIGLSTYREVASWGVWSQAADLLPSVYTSSIQAVGGVPVLLPPTQPYADAASAAVAGLGGLVITGGPDIAPDRYGQAAHERTVRWREDRDAWELALLDAAEQRQLPVLGVCRGMQLMAVHAGGELDQHVPDLVGHDRHDPGGDGFGETLVHVEPDSRIGSLVRAETLTVHCHHHQSVRSHPGFAAVAWADDGLLEAMESPGDRLCLAVQWHPEMAVDAGLFAALVLAASGS